jgi:hypothetical protein
MSSEEPRAEQTDEPVAYDNPARRLHGILAAAAQQTDNLSTRQLWSAVIDVRPNDTFGIYRRLIALSELADEVEKAIKSLFPEISHEGLLSWRSDVLTFTTGSIDAPWSNYRRSLSGTTLHSLRICADRLDEVDFNEQVIPATVLQDLASEVDDLFLQVEKSSLDPALQRMILEALEGIRRAIAEYRIRGAVGLYKAIAHARGEVLYNAPAVSAEKKKGTVEVKRFLALLTKGDDTLQRLRRWSPWLMGAVRYYLPKVADFLARLPGGEE